ncbi:MAG: 2-oxo acid dehydrogenase subunit E2 [Alicyclobacillus sp.]|nr:2-oxo acid dehydrogenase subunit E2 [Alicyclobacillus sp.]
MELIKMPRLGITMKSGTIGRWLRHNGEFVQQGEPIFELETEKTTVEVEAQESGVLHIVVEDGVEVPVGTVVGVLAAEGEEVDPSAWTDGGAGSETHGSAGEGPAGAAAKAAGSASAQTGGAAKGTLSGSVAATAHGSGAQPRSVRALPRVRRLAAELGVDLSQVSGSGAGGEITEEDVRYAAAGKRVHEAVRTEVLTGVRKAMAENLARSWAEVPQFTQMVEVDASRMVEYRNRVRREGGSVGFTEMVLHAVAGALAESPDINVRYESGRVVQLKDADIGVAVATERGLVVPVLRSLQGKSVSEIRAALQAVAERARAGTLVPEDFAGGALTVSNLGMYNVETGTPVLNPGHACLVFVGAVKEKPVVAGGGIVIRPMMGMSFTYDHRVIDGVQAARFTNQVRNALEQFG